MNMIFVYGVRCSFQWHYRVTSRSQKVVSELSVTQAQHINLRQIHHHHWRHIVDMRSSVWVPFRHTSVSAFHSPLRRPSTPTLVWPSHDLDIIIIIITVDSDNSSVIVSVLTTISRQTWDSQLPLVCACFGSRSFSVAARTIWNLHSFCRKFKTFYFSTSSHV